MDWIFPVIGDNGQLQETDRELKWEDVSLISRIKSLPKINLKHFIMNQYQDHKRRDTGCTWVSGINNVYMIMGKTPTKETYERWEALAKKRWWKEWWPWSRWAWLDIGRIIHNEEYPNDPCHTFLVWMDSPELIAYLETGRSANVSITVDSRYRWQVLVHKKLVNMDFWPGGWHATIFKWPKDKWFLDSVGRRWAEFGTEYFVTSEQIDIKRNKIYTLRNDVHIVLPVNIVPMIAKDVPVGQWYSEPVKKVIEAGIMSAYDEGKFNPHEPVTRAMLAKVITDLIDKWAIVLPKK